MATVSQLIELKNKIKQEMLRRNGHGSLEQYASAQYDISPIPTSGSPITAEHGQKTSDLLLQVKDYDGLMISKSNYPISAGFTTRILAIVNELASEQKTGLDTETSSCRGACTGLCVGSCHGQCNGCTGCTASCGTGCASGCNTSCNTGCTGSCLGSCNDTCSTGCLSTCTGATATTKA